LSDVGRDCLNAGKAEDTPRPRESLCELQPKRGDRALLMDCL